MSPRPWRLVVAALLLSWLVAGRSASASRDQDVLGPLEVSDRVIAITPRYSGKTVQVSGLAAAGDDVVLVLTAPGEAVTCSQMGKLGPFWLARGRVRVKNAPAMYKLKGSRPLREILSLEARLREHLGYAGLRASISVEGASDPDLAVNEFITLRRAVGLYLPDETGVTVATDGHFSARFFFPPGAPPGRYEIRALAVRVGDVAWRQAAPVEIRAVGIEALVGTFARAHGFVYGLLAVTTAVGVGYLMSLMGERIGPRRKASAATRAPEART